MTENKIVSCNNWGKSHKIAKIDKCIATCDKKIEKCGDKLKKINYIKKIFGGKEV